MALLLKSIKDPDRLEWHEVYPEQRLNAAEWVKEVDHYWLEIDALTEPMQVRDGSVCYGSIDK